MPLSLNEWIEIPIDFIRLPRLTAHTSLLNYSLDSPDLTHLTASSIEQKVGSRFNGCDGSGEYV